MANLLLPFYLAFSILCQNHIHAGETVHVLDTLDVIVSNASSLQPIEYYIKTFYSASLASKDVLMLNENLRHNLYRLLDSITELPSVINYSQNKKNLLNYFFNIASMYEVTLRKSKRNSKMINRKIDELALDDSYSEIRNILTKQDTVKFLTENFKEHSKIFSNACSTKMSHIQLLDSLLSRVQIATAQYYTAKCLLAKCSNESNNIISNKLLERIQTDYKTLVKTFKGIMATSSREFWTCGADSITKLMNHERKYFFVLNKAESNISDNRVITGARLVVESSLIFIQIQDAKILRNGLIDSSTVRWVPLNKDRVFENVVRVPRNLESIELTEIPNIGSGEVITGLKFLKGDQGVYAKRLRPQVFSCGYNHTNGKIKTYQQRVYSPSDATEEHLLHDNNTSITTLHNDSLSHVRRYVTFRIVKNEDGGQNMIPFIDTQNVESERVAPLSGLGFYVRDEPGYGAVLALKLFSLNIDSYIKI